MRAKSGVALLEALIAVTIVSITSLSAITMVRETAHAITRARARDQELRQASAFLTTATLWTRGDLDRRLGSRAQGAWKLHIEREGSTLYVLSLRDSTGRFELLRTSVFRKETVDARR